MYRYRRMIVGMNLNEKDPVLVREAARLAELGGSEKIVYLHVLSAQEIPEKISKEYPQLLSPFHELAEERIKKTVLENSSESDIFECRIREGLPIKVILEEVKALDADIVLLGRNYSHKRSNKKLTENIARKAPCSVFIVPSESHYRKIKNIMVASDGSSHSKSALEEAILLAKSLRLESVSCLTVYHVPMGYHSTGKSYEEFAEIMLANAKLEFKELTEGLDVGGIDIKPVFELDEHVEKGILSAVNRESVDILIVGARGRSTGASILLGSVTEHLIGNINIPLLAVKNKSAGVDFFEAMLDVLMTGN